MKFERMILILFLVFLISIPIAFGEDNITDENDLSIVDITESEEHIELYEDESIGNDLNETFYDTDKLQSNNDYENELENSETTTLDVSEAYEYLNKFRSEKGIWYWNSDDTTITYFNTNNHNQLKPLTRDIGLEEGAKIRAKEFDTYPSLAHNRPNGLSWNTAYPYYVGAECLSQGVDIESCIDYLKETYKNHSGQGHRQSMIYPYFNCVGIAIYKTGYFTSMALSFGYTKEYETNDTTIEEPPLLDSQKTFTDLNNLVTNTNITLNNDYIYTTNDSQFEYGIDIENSITIEGKGHIIDARKSARVFRIISSNVTLKNIVFKNGNKNYNSGGLVFAQNSKITIINCSFINSDSYTGSAIFSYNSEILVENCNFTDNIAVNGTIHLLNSVGIVKNSYFNNNSAIFYAGGICSSNSNVSIENCNFINNSVISIFSGGAIHSGNNDNTSITLCSFFNNSAEMGGAISCLNNTISIEKCIIYNNSAVRGGGAYGDNCKIKIINSDFANNNLNLSNDYLKREGGGIYLINSSTQVINSNFTNNSVNHRSDNFQGGGAISSNYGNLTVTNCRFYKNFAEKGGGGIYSLSSKTKIIFCNFTNNIVYSKGRATIGSAIFSGTSEISIYNSVFLNNQANSSYYSPSGGAIYSNINNITIENCNFTNNTIHNAKYYYDPCGGAIRFSHSNATILHCNFNNNNINHWTTYGESIFSENGKIIIMYCNFTNTPLNTTSHTTYGGAIYSYNDNITIKYNTFANNFGTNGGAISMVNGNITISNCNFINNTVMYHHLAYGGAIYAKKCNLSIENSNFTNNIANQMIAHGSAIYLSNSNTTLEHCNFKNNHGKYRSGGIYSENGETNVNYCIFINNTSEQGGAIYSDKNKDFIRNCIFTGNTINETSSSHGGAVYARNSYMLIEYSTFSQNFAKSKGYACGGAIYNYYSDVFLKYCNLTNNSVESSYAAYGGAIYLDYGKISLENCKLVDNQIKSTYSRGGAIYTENSETLLDTCNFENNSANIYGGAIYSFSSNNTLKYSMFNHNIANNYAGAIFTSNSTNIMEYCNYNNNFAPLGGVIYSTKSNSTINDCNFNNNHGTRFGGALYLNKDVTVLIDECNFNNNSAEYGGNAIYSKDTDTYVKNSIFDNEKNLTITGNTIIINSTFGKNSLDNVNTTVSDTPNTTDNREKTHLELFDYYGFVNQAVTLSARLWDSDENYWLTGENIEFWINDERYPSFTQGQLGVALFRYAFNKAGTYYFSVNYSGNEEYRPCNGTGKIIIKNPIEAQISTDLNFNNATITVDLGKNIDGEIIINIDDSDQKWTLGYLYNEYKLKIQNGKAVLKLDNLKDRTYHFTVELNSTLYEFEETVGSEFKIVTYKTHLVADDINMFAGNELIYHIELYDEEEIGFENQTIHIYLNNRQYDLKTDENGSANLHVNLTSGNYPIIISYDGFNNTFLPVKLTKNIIVKPTTAIPQNSEFAPNSHYEIQLFDRQGNVLANTEIDVKIDGVKQNLITDSTGKLSILLNLKDGKHSIEITNPKTGEIIKKEITIKSNNNNQQPQSKAKKINPKKIIRTKNISVKKGKKIIFKARLYNINGKILKGKKVTFKFKGKKYKVKTNKKGVATLKLKIKLKKGKYTIKTTYQKYTVKNKIRIK